MFRLISMFRHSLNNIYVTSTTDTITEIYIVPSSSRKFAWVKLQTAQLSYFGKFAHPQYSILGKFLFHSFARKFVPKFLLQVLCSKIFLAGITLKFVLSKKQLPKHVLIFGKYKFFFNSPI